MIVAMHQCRDQLPVDKLAIVSSAAFAVLFDKIKARGLAISCEMPVAKGCQLRAGDDAESLVRKLGLPLAIKTRSSVFERALIQANARL